MRKSFKTIAAASALFVGLTTASALYAQQGPSGTMGAASGGMMGMMGQMAENCNTLMTSMMTNLGMPPSQGRPEAQPAPPGGNDQDK